MAQSLFLLGYSGKKEDFKKREGEEEFKIANNCRL